MKDLSKAPQKRIDAKIEGPFPYEPGKDCDLILFGWTCDTLDSLYSAGVRFTITRVIEYFEGYVEPSTPAEELQNSKSKQTVILTITNKGDFEYDNTKILLEDNRKRLVMRQFQGYDDIGFATYQTRELQIVMEGVEIDRVEFAGEYGEPEVPQPDTAVQGISSELGDAARNITTMA